MSTRSFIARKTDRGYEGVYCHWSGYLDYNGRILQKYYIDPAKVQELIAHGDISMLGQEVGHKHDFDTHTKEQTTFYGRDRGNKDTAPALAKTLKQIMKHAKACGSEYFYLFQNGHWYYAQRGVQCFGMDNGEPFSAIQQLVLAP